MLVTTNHLQVNYGRFTALSIDRPITISEGERIGIIGSNGAGKSTFIKAVLGLVNYKGTIHSELKPEEMAVHLQFNEYADTMPVKYVLETILNTSIRKNERLKELIDYLDFGPCLKKKYSALSGGQKQRLTIIMVMMQDAPLTFFDEVTSGLDFETRQKLMEKLGKWYENKESALCIVSHYYEELQQLADKLLILDKGHLIDFGKKEELFYKYCGNAILMVDQNEKNEELLRAYDKLKAPEQSIAVSCRTPRMEEEIASLLIANNVNFKRTNNDIELISINAKAAYYEAKGEEIDEKENL